MQDSTTLQEQVWRFIRRCRRDDGGYAPSPDPAYSGCSDTRASDIAAATYAAVLARSFGRSLPDAQQTAEFLHRRQQPDGRFINFAGEFDPGSDLAILYNTTQAVVGLRALGEFPRRDSQPVIARFFDDQAFANLPWYTTSFFPLFYGALGQPFPADYQAALRAHMTAQQAADGYLGDHVAATFHMAHFFRLIGEPTPRAAQMVGRVLREQTPEGGWNIRAPDWDVHSCFDAVFILRQLGAGSESCRHAMEKAAEWAMRCRNADRGFGHYPGWSSDMDAVYFQLGTLIQAGTVPSAMQSALDGRVLGWGHAMDPAPESLP